MKKAVVLKLFLFLFVLLGLTACGGGGGSDPEPTPTDPIPDPTPDPTSISGGGVKGPLANAVVTVYAFDASQPGFKGAVVAAAVTDANAAITGLALPFPVTPPYIMEFTSTPGTTTDITTGLFPVITTLRTVITQFLLDGGEQIYATPLTTMAVDIAIANGSTSTTAVQFEAALTAAATQVVSTLGFGMDSSIDIFDTPPLIDSTTISTEQQTNVAAYRAAVEAVTAIAFEINKQTAGGNTDSVLAELTADLADGIIDGMVDGNASAVITTNTLQVLQQDPATLDIPSSDPANPTGLTVGDVQTILADEAVQTAPATDVAALTDGTSIVTEISPAEPNPDSDGDGVLNVDDAFPGDATETVDTDGDGIGDNADPDDNNNGILDVDEGSTPVPTVTDTDGDGFDDGVDNCPTNFNPAQTNTDGDAEGDACDADDDNDGVDDTVDAFPLDAAESIDTDNDGLGDNVADTDDDNDGVLDVNDTGISPLDGTECAVLIDCDGDGVFDGADFAPTDDTITFNFAPIVTNDTATANEDDTTFAIDVTTNDTDDGVPGALTLTAIGTHDTNLGTAVISGSNIDYTPVPNASGSDTFSYTVSDGAVSSTGSVTVTITAVNDAPAFTSTEITAVNEDTAYSYTAVATDVDPADTLILSALTLPAWLSFDAGTGVLSGTPVNANVGVYDVVIRVNDGTVDVDQSFNVTVTNVNDAPAFTSTAVTAVNEDATYSYTASATDIDAGASLTLSAPTLPAWLTFTPATGILTGTPTNAEVGVHAVVIRVNDGAVDVDQSFNITVANTNDAPTFSTTAVIAASEDSPYSYDANVSDVDAGDSLTLSTLGLSSWLNFDPVTGILSGAPLNADVGDHNITIRVNDGTVDVDQTFTILVANTNDAPVLTGDAVTVGAGIATQIDVLINDNDVDVGDPLTITSVTQGATGSVVNNGSSVTYTDTSGTAGSDSFTYTVTDNGGINQTATVNVTVTLDTPPAFSTTPVLSVNEDSEYVYSFAASDVDGDVVTLSVIDSPAWMTGGNISAPDLSPFGSIVGTPTNADVSVHLVTIRASSNGVDVDQTFNITVSNTNDAPTFTTNPTLAITEGNAYSYIVNVNDIDPGPDTLTLSAPTLPTWMAFNAGTGELSGAPTVTEVGSHAVVIRVNDGTVDVDQSFNVTVNNIGTLIDMSILMDVTNGGVAGVEMDGPNEFEYWTDSYDSVNSVFVFEDKAYNYSTGVFDTVVDDDDLLLDGSNWVARGDIDGTFNVSALDLSIRNQADTATLASYKLTARYISISGQLIIDHLEDVEWQNAMLDPAAVFGADAKLITEYNFEVLSDSFWLWKGDWCKDDGTSTYGDLNGNCNAVNVDLSVNSTGYAQLLSETTVATAWVDPNDDYSTPPGAIQVAWNNANNNVLMVQLVNGGAANYYVVDWNSADPASHVADAVPGTNWVQDSSSGVEMIQYLIPDTLIAQFPDDLNEGLNYFFTVLDGFVRKGSKSLTGDVESEGGHLNGAALNDVLANFDAIQAIGYNYTDVTAQPLYDLYNDAAVPTWCIDSYDFYGNGNYDGYDYAVCSGTAGSWSDTYSINAATGVMTIVDGAEIFYKKVIGFNSNYAAKETCVSLSEAGPFNCIEGGDFFGYEFTDPTAAENAMDVLNTPAPAIAFPDAAILAGTTQYNVFYCDDCTPEGWIMESLEFDVDGSTYTLTTIPGGTPEVGSYSVVNGILIIDEGSFQDYIQIMSVDGVTGANRTCWESSLSLLSNCDEPGYEFFFDNQTGAQNFLDSLTFSAGSIVDAATLLADGIYEFWDNSWDGSQQVPAYWTMSVNGSVIVDSDFIWSRALNKFLPEGGADTDIMLTTLGWQQGSGDITDAVISGNQATFNIRAPDNEIVQSFVVTYEAMDITGSEIGLFAPAGMLANQSATFSVGAQQIKETAANGQDYIELDYWEGCAEYATWGNNCNVLWYRQMTGLDVDTNHAAATDLSFIDTAGATIELGWHQYAGSNSTSLLGVFSSSGSTISYYTVNWDAGTTAVDTGIVGSYTLSTVDGEQIIEYTVPDSIPNYDWFNLYYDLEDSETGILAVHNGFLRHGDKEPSTATGTWIDLNSVAANDIFNNMPAAPAVYGTWIPSDYSDLTTAPNVITFFADNNYMHSGTSDDPALSGTLVTGGLLGPEANITGAAPELGPYTWDAVTGDFTVNPVVDANAWAGLNDTSNGSNSGTITVSGDVMTFTNLDGTFTLDRVIPATSPIVGSWVLNDPNDPVVFTFFENGRYNESQTCYDHETTTDGVNYTPEPIEGGIEYGTYTWDEGGTNVLSGVVIIDTDGWCGIHDTNNAPDTAAGGFPVTIDGDVMTAVIPGEPDVTFYRIQ